MLGQAAHPLKPVTSLSNSCSWCLWLWQALSPYSRDEGSVGAGLGGAREAVGPGGGWRPRGREAGGLGGGPWGGCRGQGIGWGGGESRSAAARSLLCPGEGQGG